jgi:hypothetical protein
MDNTTRKRLAIAVLVVLFFVVIILVWYFFYAKPTESPITKKGGPYFGQQGRRPGDTFILSHATSSSVTFVSDPLKDPLVQIWDKPATGETYVVQNIMKDVMEKIDNGSSTVEVKKSVKATSTIVMFVDRETGYIYGYPIETGKIFQISNTLIPGIHDAYIFGDGTRVLMRYIDQQKNTVVGVIATIPHVPQIETPLPLTHIEYLNSKVVSVAISQDKEEVSYVVATDNGSSIYTLDKERDPVLVASSPFKEWDLSYGGKSLYVTTKPSAYIEGMTFSLPLFQSEIVKKTGLMTLPDESGNLFASMWGKQGLVTFLYNNGATKVFSVQTLTKKCAYGSESLLVCGVPRTIPRGSEGLPDDWFQGAITFQDDLSVINKNEGIAYPLYSFDSTKEGDFDVYGIVVSEKNDLYTFLRRQDETLWLLNTNLIVEEHD